MRAALACLAVGSLVACGGGGGGGGAPGPRRPVGPAIDPATAQQGASDLVTEIYDTLGRGNKDSVFTLLEDSLMVFGPRGGDMLGTRADALVALGQVVDPKAKKNLAISSVNIEVIPGPGGHSALVFDPAILNGQPHTILAVVDNTNDLWLVGTVAVAYTPTEAQLKAELAKEAVVPPGATGVRKIDPAARAAVEKFQRGLLDQAAWGDELTSQKDALVIGPTGGEVARGKQAIRELWKKRVGAKTRAAVAGEITAAVTGDGQLAWVSAPITRVEGEGTQPLPLRAFAVYQRAGGDWKLLALQESLAFSAPGAGASYKRFLPPRPVEPKAPEVIAARPKDGGAGKSRGKAEGGAAKDRPEDKKSKTAFAAAEPRKKEKEPEKKVTVKEARADDADETPRRKKKKRSFFGSDDDGAADAKKKEKEKEPEKKVAKEAKADDADEAPRRKRKRSFSRSDDDSAEEGRKKEAKADDADEAPRRKKKKRSFSRSEDERADEDAPKKKKLAKTEDAEEEAPKKKSKTKTKAKADDADDEPVKESTTKKKKLAEAEADEESVKEAPKKKSKAKAEDVEETPKKKSKAKAEDVEETPKKKKLAKAEADEEPVKETPKKKAKTEDAEEAPKKKAKTEDAEEAPKKKARAKAKPEDAEEDAKPAPKKKKKPAAEDDDEIEVID